MTKRFNKVNDSTMKALLWNGALGFKSAYPVPEPSPGWALIKVSRAGICGTDLEIMKGYKSFKGVPGHEFTGKVVSAPEHEEWIGRRVAGEINIGCGRCAWCLGGKENHCPDRRVIGIAGLDGCMAEYCTLPVGNLIEIPDDISDDAAVFLEPLAAACRILDQIPLEGREKFIVLGDGCLGILSSWVLSTVVKDVHLLGRHGWKLEKARWRGMKTSLASQWSGEPVDIVVEATGSPDGIADALRLCRPLGTVMLKTTVSSQIGPSLTQAVVKEITIVGSRCGKMGKAINLINTFPDIPIELLVTAVYRLEQASEAFSLASGGPSLKVLFKIP